MLGELAPLLTLLRRFATEAAREEARLFCDELVGGGVRRRGLLGRGVIARRIRQLIRACGPRGR